MCSQSAGSDLFMKTKKYLQFLLSSKLGDGCYVKHTSGSCYLQFVSFHLDYITLMKSNLDSNGIKTSNLRIQKSGYKKDSSGYAFTSRIDERIKEVYEMSVIEVITNLNAEGLCYLFIDDGSFHQRKHFGHIYCNSFSDEEVEALINKIYELYPDKKCSKRLDKKKDGRVYPYIYIPVSVMNTFKKDLEEFIRSKEIYSFLYKVGQPSQTIEKQK